MAFVDFIWNSISNSRATPEATADPAMSGRLLGVEFFFVQAMAATIKPSGLGLLNTYFWRGTFGYVFFAEIHDIVYAQMDVIWQIFTVIKKKKL